jgi:hypothetical protein
MTLVWKPEVMSLLGKCGRRWNDNFKINIKVEGIHLAQDSNTERAVVNTVRHLRVLSK